MDQGLYQDIPDKLPFGSALSDAWAGFLYRFDFDWFLTLTFREQIHPEAASKVFRRFVNDLNKSIYGRRWTKKPHGGVYWARGLEWQKRGVIHFHALMGSWTGNPNHEARRMTWVDHWNELAGFARIEPVRNARNASAYVSKYVAKDGQIDLSGNLHQPLATPAH